MNKNVDIELEEEWELWTAKYRKIYGSEQSRQERRNIWLRNYSELKDHNKQYDAGKLTYRISQNHFSDQTTEELVWINGLEVVDACRFMGIEKYHEEKPNSGESSGRHEKENNSEEFDWRKQGYTVPEQNQERDLPICWIFGAVAAVELHYQIKNKKFIKLSDQQLVDGIEEGDKPGNLEVAFEYIRKNGVAAADDYPYVGKKEVSRVDKRKAVEIEGWNKITPGDEKELENVVTILGPVAVGIISSNRFKFARHNYEDIFYDPEWEKGLNLLNKDALRHVVLVVGYGKDPSKPPGEDKYWIVTTSWKPEDENDPNSGYMKIAKDRGNNCNIAGCAMYPVGVTGMKDDTPAITA